MDKIKIKMIAPLEASSIEKYISKLCNHVVLARTGVEPKGSCFFHAVYYAFREFRELSPEEKTLYIKRKRKDLADRISVATWFQVQKGDVAFLQIIEMMRVMVYLIPSFITDPQESMVLSSYNIDTKLLDVLFHLLDPAQVDHHMLPRWDIECSKIDKNEMSKDILLHRMKSKWHQIYQDNIRKAVHKIESELGPSVEKMSETKKMAVIHKLSDISYFLFDFVAEKALLSFREDIASYSTWVNTFHYLYLVESMNIGTGILFIDASTGMPYEGMRYFDLSKLQNETNYIVLLYFPDYHFESIGEHVVMNNKKVLNRIFRSDHPLVQSFFNYLSNTKPVQQKQSPQPVPEEKEIKEVQFKQDNEYEDTGVL